MFRSEPLFEVRMLELHYQAKNVVWNRWICFWNWNFRHHRRKSIIANAVVHLYHDPRCYHLHED